MNISNTQPFRTAAVLYADNGTEVTSVKTSKRKIIESIFLENENKELLVSQLGREIETKLSLTFSEDEIKDIVNSENKESSYFVGNIDACGKCFNLTVVQFGRGGPAISHKNANIAKKCRKTESPPTDSTLLSKSV